MRGCVSATYRSQCPGRASTTTKAARLSLEKAEEIRMPVFGPIAGDDGAVGVSSESDKAGLVGRNEGSGTPPPGSPGGAGVLGLTTVPGGAGVFGANTVKVPRRGEIPKGVGIQGNGPDAGVSGFSERGAGLRAHSNLGDGTQSFAHDSQGNGVTAANVGTVEPEGPTGNGVLATTTVPNAAGILAANMSTKGVGVQGNGPDAGVSGFSENGAGVRAHSTKGDGAQAFAHAANRNGLLGLNDAKSKAVEVMRDIEGRVVEQAPSGNGVFGYTDVPEGSGVCGAVSNDNRDGSGITGIGPTAGRFFGDVDISASLSVAGNLTVRGDVLLPGADLAEEFATSAPAALVPGSLIALDHEGNAGLATVPYDRRVVGVVSGSGAYKPAIILDSDAATGSSVRIALSGKVHCMVDADHGAIEVGDPLTSSPTSGHAMLAADAQRAFGAVVGKAMARLGSGQGTIPILVSLQ